LVLLTAKQHMLAADSAKIVCTDEQIAWRWLKRYPAEGLTGKADAPRPGAMLP
jgi:hypothetical protein